MKKEFTYKELYNKWEKFINGGNDLSHLDREIAQSWIRCRESNVNPFHKPDILSSSEILKLLNRNKYLLDVVKPYIPLITEMAKETNFIFVLADKDGYVLDVRGEKEAIERAKKSNFTIGANRSEIVGTNVISLAISYEKPFQLAGPEHYNINFHQWTCSSTPIKDNYGNLIGVLNLSGHYSLKHTHTLGMVISLARAIEKEIAYRDKFSNQVRKQSQVHSRYSFDQIIGKSKPIQSAIEMAKVVSKTDARVVVEGESGTGKELFVQAIHHDSLRQNGPFIAVNCGAIPEQLMESELFGYDDGAFTGAKKGGKEGKFEQANGGTLFLDEINSMPKDLQVKLLRVLQENEITRVGGNTTIPIDVRVIAASNQPLEKLLEEGKFREDLFYRLGIITIEIPSLRQRKDDIPELFTYLLRKVSHRHKINQPEIDPAIFKYLQHYHWPGNIREFENYIERAVVLSQGKKISIGHFPKKITEQMVLQRTESLTSLETLEKESIKKALELNDGNISKTSKILGITRKTLYKKIRDYELEINQISYIR